MALLTIGHILQKIKNGFLDSCEMEEIRMLLMTLSNKELEMLKLELKDISYGSNQNKRSIIARIENITAPKTPPNRKAALLKTLYKKNPNLKSLTEKLKLE